MTTNPESLLAVTQPDTCPFCKGEWVVINRPANGGQPAVKCKGCNASGPFAAGMTDEQIVAAWNTRPAPPAQPLTELREALRLFTSAAYPVAPEINPRGYNWSEAYLDQALENAAALHPLTELQRLGQDFDADGEVDLDTRMARAAGNIPAQPGRGEVVSALDCVGLAVWCVSIADHHADTLTPKQIEKLYAASDALRAAEPLLARQDVRPEAEPVARADNFNGSTAHLLDCIDAFLDLTDDKAFVPHNLDKGSHAYRLLVAARVRLEASIQSEAKTAAEPLLARQDATQISELKWAAEMLSRQKWECSLGISAATKSQVRCEHCTQPAMECYKMGRVRDALKPFFADVADCTAAALSTEEPKP